VSARVGCRGAERGAVKGGCKNGETQSKIFLTILMPICYNANKANEGATSNLYPNRKPRYVAIGVFMWLIVVAAKAVVKPLADVICYYTCYDSFYEGNTSNLYPLLSVAFLPEWSGDNKIIVAQSSSTYQ